MRRTIGGGLLSRTLLLGPFVVGGLAGAWLALTSLEPVLVTIGWAGSVLAAGTIVLLLTAAPGSWRQPGLYVRRRRRGERWQSRRLWSLMVRSVAVFAPIGVSMSTALAVQQALPAPDGIASVALNGLILVVCGFAVLYPAERATRRLGPIAMLLKLSLAFPSSAPSRFRVARRSANPTTLRRTLEAPYIPDDPSRTEIAATLLSLLAALTAHDSRTRGHSERVRVLSEMLAKELGLHQHDRERLRWSALLHDIGKLAVSAEILNKPGPLDESQWQTMYRHPEFGAKLVAPLAPWLGEWGSAVEEHHERLDGSGYPQGLSRGEISLGARIIAVADAFDTMVSPRPYRGARSPAAAREEVASLSARQFDPSVVRALLSSSIPRLWWRIGLAAWLAQLPVLRWGSDRARRNATRTALPVAGILAGVVVVVALASLGMLGSHPLTSPNGGGQMRSALESTASGTLDGAPGSGSGGAQLTADEARAPSRADQGKAHADTSEPSPVIPPPVQGAGGQGAGAGGGDLGGGTAGGTGGGGSVGGAGSGGTVGAAGGGGTAVEANSDATVGGTTGNGTVGGAGAPPGGTQPPATEPPSTQEPPSSTPPDACDDGGPGRNGHGHAYGHCKDKGKG